uniref:Farnesyl pyrophosphate synthase n=1 Tax=Phaeomonas parva TaxID=124430 RepID=A0A7S1U9D8_9STRA|mmetsp:Transcript_36909/g.115578  ORF Transcript_36909/g.115578 Transcript_36909/m.115578 type:complete len:547 (+) Transcript_36909:95-1735(+)
MDDAEVDLLPEDVVKVVDKARSRGGAAVGDAAGGLKEKVEAVEAKAQEALAGLIHEGQEMAAGGARKLLGDAAYEKAGPQLEVLGALQPFFVPVIGGVVLLGGLRVVLGPRMGGRAGKLLCVPVLALALGLLSSDEASADVSAVLALALRLDDVVKLAVASAFFAATYLVADLCLGAGDGGSSAPRRRDLFRRYPRKLPPGRKEAFLHMLPLVLQTVTEELEPVFALPLDVYEYVKALMDYNVPGGQLDRGIMVLECMEQFEQARRFHKLGVEARCQAVTLGWCVEMLQASFFVADDVMSGANMRRAQPCWYKRPDVAQNAVNDAVLLKNFVFRVLQRHFGDKPYYARLQDLFLTVSYQTHLGVLLYLTRQSYTSPKDLNRFTQERWSSIAKYRIAMYSVYLPIAIGMVVNGVTDDAAYQQLEVVSAQMGEYIQAHEDYLSGLRGRGGDISSSKCTWLVVKALQKAGMDQRRALQQNYGVMDPAAVATVKALYNDLGLEGDFHQYEEEAYRNIKKSVRSPALRELPKGLFDTVLGAIFNNKSSHLT